MAGPLDEINNNIKKINQQAAKKRFDIRAIGAEGMAESFQKSLEVGKSLKDPMTYASMLPPVAAVKGAELGWKGIKKAWKTGSAFLSLPARTAIHTAGQDPYLATQMFSGPASMNNPVTMQSYAAATLLGGPVPTSKERPSRTMTPPGIPSGIFSSIPGRKRALPHVPEYVDQEVNVPAGVAEGWKEHFPYMLRGGEEFINIMQGDEVSRNTLRIMTDKSLGFNEKNKLLQEQYDSLSEWEKFVYDHANPGQWAVDILGGKAIARSGPAWRALGRATGIPKLIRKWKIRGKTVYAPEKPGAEAVEEQLESVRDIDALNQMAREDKIGEMLPPLGIAGIGAGAGMGALEQPPGPIPPIQPPGPIPPVERLGEPGFIPEKDPTRIQEAGFPIVPIAKAGWRVAKPVLKKLWDPSEFVTKLQKIGKPDGWGQAIDNMLAKQAEVEKEGLVGAVTGTKGEFIPRMPWVGKVIDWMPQRLVPKSLRGSKYIRAEPPSKQQEVSTVIRFLASDDPVYGNIGKGPDGRPGWQVFREDVQRAGFKDVDELQEVMIDSNKAINNMQIQRVKEVEDIRAEFTPQLQEVGIGIAKRAREGKILPGQKAAEITEKLTQTASRAGREYKAPVMEKDLGQVIDEIAKIKGISNRVNGETVKEFLLGDLYIHLNEHSKNMYKLYSQNINPDYLIPNAFGDTIKGPWDLLNYQLNVGAMFSKKEALLPGKYTLGLLTEILGPTVTEPLRIARIKVQKGALRQFASDMAPGPVRNAYFDLIAHFEKAEVGKGPWQTAAARANKLIIDPSKKGWTDLTRYSVWDYLTDTAGAWKTTESSFDNSIPLIQGYPLLMESPKVWFNAWKVSARAWLPGGGGRVDKTLEAIMVHPLYNVAARAGLVIPKRGSGQEIEQAQLLNTFIGRIMRHLWPSAAQAENAAIGFISSARFNYFIREYEKMITLKKSLGQPEVLTKDEMDAIVNWAHLITGRGPLGDFLDKRSAEGGLRAIHAIMNATVFSVRKNSADFMYAPTLLKNMAEGRSVRMGVDNAAEANANIFTRVLAQQRSRAAIIMFYRGLTFLKTVGFLAGLREMLDKTRGDDELLDWFEDNLKASFLPGSTFLKFRIGKTWDSPFASQAQVASFIYELLFGERWTSTGVKMQIGLGKSLEKFGRNKLSPLASAILGYSTGRGYGGEWFNFKEDLNKAPALDNRSSFWYRHLTSISLETLVEIWDNYIVQPSIPDQIKKRLGIPTDIPTPTSIKEMLETQPDQKILGLIAGIAGFHGRGSTWMAPEEEVSRALDIDIKDIPTSVMGEGKKALRAIELEKTGVIRDSEFEELRDNRDASIEHIKYNTVKFSQTGEEKTVMEWAEDFKTTKEIPYEIKQKISDMLFSVTSEHRIATQALLKKPGRISGRDTDIERQRAGMDTKNRLLSQWWEQAARAQDMDSYSKRFIRYIEGIYNSKELTDAEKKEATQHIYASAYPYEIPGWLLKFLPPTTQEKIDKSRQAASWALEYYKSNGSTDKVDNNR